MISFRGAQDRTALQEQKKVYKARDITDGLPEFERQEDGIYVRTRPFRTILDVRSRDRYQDIITQADLVIIGCSPDIERSVCCYRDTGTLFTRYSIFYGRPSEYSGLSPEEIGYAFDIPKEMERFLSFITAENIATVICERDPLKVRQALGEFNDRLELIEPVIATQHLEKAMKIPRDQQQTLLKRLFETEK